jgi:hypothetical protein
MTPPLKIFSIKVLPFALQSDSQVPCVVVVRFSGVAEVEPSVSGRLHEKTRAKDFPFPAGKEKTG